MSALTAEQVQGLIRLGVPMAEDIDLRIDHLDGDKAVARVPFHGKLVRPGGTLSGPTIMALADAAMYAVVLGRLGRVEMAVTANLNINFLSKPAALDLIAEARILRLSKRQAVCEVELYSQGREVDLVAHVTGTYALPLSVSAMWDCRWRSSSGNSTKPSATTCRRPRSPATGITATPPGRSAWRISRRRPNLR